MTANATVPTLLDLSEWEIEFLLDRLEGVDFEDVILDTFEEAGIPVTEEEAIAAIAEAAKFVRMETFDPAPLSQIVRFALCDGFDGSTWMVRYENAEKSGEVSSKRVVIERRRTEALYKKMKAAGLEVTPCNGM